MLYKYICLKIETIYFIYDYSKGGEEMSVYHLFVLFLLSVYPFFVYIIYAILSATYIVYTPTIAGTYQIGLATALYVCIVIYRSFPLTVVAQLEFFYILTGLTPIPSPSGHHINVNPVHRTYLSRVTIIAFPPPSRWLV